MIIFLVGYMGCGKSSLGKVLARELGYDFVDMDAFIEQQCDGMKIVDIFAMYGEPYFRALEKKTLSELGRREHCIVATGGGAPVGEGNMEAMNETGETIYLKMSPDSLVMRLKRGRDRRPLIKQMDDGQLLKFIEENLAIREPHYLKAKIVIDCNGVGDIYIVDHIKEILKYKQYKTCNYDTVF